MESIQKSLMFRPETFGAKYKLKHNPVGQWHHRERRASNNHVWRVGGYLHYLADHAPRAVNKKWKTAFRKFCKLHPKF
jgi:hypothetical protein